MAQRKNLPCLLRTTESTRESQINYTRCHFHWPHDITAWRWTSTRWGCKQPWLPAADETSAFDTHYLWFKTRKLYFILWSCCDPLIHIYWWYFYTSSTKLTAFFCTLYHAKDLQPMAGAAVLGWQRRKVQWCLSCYVFRMRCILGSVFTIVRSGPPKCLCFFFMLGKSTEKVCVSAAWESFRAWKREGRKMLLI